ncbi:GNAT family N-acetyltransferase [Allomesorhizobium alhagi]|jgi:aminoglycoside 6'-N-acetyltransferase|uniref:GCN5-related N-acetyltransferase n=1 Tax=Mesorhizobium alhagi CCNWXJ12-2 TaxID=1107882 RepID=H0HKW1_9HYPH|nr:GNAT family N-acetyltransferase [Mesorhizobium alhagi]EHK58605.1 GCN5-related N-acetyltransferase [Mesorhizobium alhagi CCNWXJ12-2]
MPPRAESIRFEPVAEEHLPMLHGWLKQRHVRQWWGDPDEELALIRSILEEDDGTEGYVVFLDRKPVGYVQSWRPANFGGTHWVEEAPWLNEVPPDTMGVDVFIGPANLIARGVGPRIIRAFAERLFALGTPRLIIDPDAANRRAVRAYEKAGFVAFGRHDRNGESTILMEITPDRLERAA